MLLSDFFRQFAYCFPNNVLLYPTAGQKSGKCRRVFAFLEYVDLETSISVRGTYLPTGTIEDRHSCPHNCDEHRRENNAETPQW